MAIHKRSDKQRYFDAICHARGMILQSAIELEIIIDLYIAKYFTENNQSQSEFIALILTPRMNYQSKIEVFDYLISKHNTAFKKENPKIISDLVLIGEERNRFAHFPIENTQERLDDYIVNGNLTLNKYKSGKQGIKTEKKFHLLAKITFHNKRVLDFVDLMHNYADAIEKQIISWTGVPSEV